MSASIRGANRLGAGAGIGFAGLLFVSVASVDPQRGVSDDELLTWWTNDANRNAFVLSMFTLLLAAPLFLVFVSRLRSRLRVGDESFWADTAFASGIVISTGLGLCAVLRGVIAGSVRFADEPLPGVDTLRFATDLAYSVWDLVMVFALLMVTIVTGLALTGRALPRWSAGLGALVVLGSAVLMASRATPIALPLLIIWVITHSVLLLRTPADAPAHDVLESVS